MHVEAVSLDQQARVTETKFFTFGGKGEEPLRLQNGERLGPVTLAYQTYGRLAPDRDNAILLFHALSGSQNAAGYNPSVPGVGDLWREDCRVGWWDDFIGPGKALDTDLFFVVCANYLGGCYGSTGPGSVDPRTGRPYGSRFPGISLCDIVDSQMRLADFLGIGCFHAATGGSLGGLLALTAATRYPQRVRTVIPIACGHEVTILQRIHNFEQVYAIEADPHFQGGDFYGGPRPAKGLALARMIAHKTYVSLQVMEARARGETVRKEEDLKRYEISHPVESYMLHQGRKFVDRFDANTYLRIMQAWQRFDLVADTGAMDIQDVFSRCRDQRFLVFSIDSDVCSYPEEQAGLVRVLKDCGVPTQHITVHSDKGHDSFLLEPELFAPYLSFTLKRDR
jgi:homoserine O-acetyltransferase